MRHCLNCGHTVAGKYCPNCGQAISVGRISWKSFLEELVHLVTHAERSLLGTSWQLLKKPGKVLDEYIGGKRKKYQSPVAFFLIWVTLCIVTQRLTLYHQGFHPVFLEGLTFRHAESIE